MTVTRCSPYTSVTLSLGTGEECRVKNPPNLSHLSNEHLGGLLSSVHAEWKSRNLSDLHQAYANSGNEEIYDLKIEPEGALLNIGLEK
jgi:hypothetical protein